MARKRKTARQIAASKRNLVKARAKRLRTLPKRFNTERKAMKARRRAYTPAQKRRNRKAIYSAMGGNRGMAKGAASIGVHTYLRKTNPGLAFGYSTASLVRQIHKNGKR